MIILQEIIRCFVIRPQVKNKGRLSIKEATGYYPGLHGKVIVRPLSTVGYTSVVASVIHSRQWSNYLNS